MGNVTGGTVLWILEVPTDKFDAALDRSSRKAEVFGHNLDKVGARAASNFSGELGNAFSSIGSGLGRLVKGFAIAGAAGSVGFGSMITAAVDQQRAVENARFALRAYEGDASKVNTVLSDLVQFATSPLGTLFQREELFKAASNLKVFGDETGKLTGHIKIMSRAVALGFTSFDELSQILGRVGAAGKLTGVDFDVLTARGIKLPDTMRNAAVSFDTLFQAVNNAIPEGVLEGRADSIDGRLIRLKSSFRNLGASILGINRDTNEFVEGGLGDRMLKLLDSLRETLGSPEIKTAFTELGKSVAAFAERALPLLIKGIEFIARNITNIAPAFVALAAAWVTASIAGAILGAVFLAISSPAYLVAAAITAIVGVITFLQLKFDIFGKTLRVIGTVGEEVGDALGGAFDTFEGVVSDLVDGTLKFFKDRIDDVGGAFEAAQKFIDDHKEGLKQIAGVITVVLGPAFVKLGVQAGITATKMAIAAGVAAAQWVAQAVIAGVAWTVQFAIMSANAIAHTVVSSAQAVIAGLRWVQAAAGVAASWVAQFALMSVKAIATVVVFTAQASISGYVWVFQATRASAAWLIAFPKMALGAIRTAATFTVNAVIAGAGWIAQAVVSGAAWLIAFAGMAAAAIATGISMAAAAIGAGVAWLIALGPILLIIAAVVAGAALIVANWDKVRGFFIGIFEWIKERWPLLLAILFGPFGIAAALVIKNWEKVKDFFGAIGGFVLNAIGNLGSLLFNTGKDLIQGLLNGAGSLLSKIGEFFLDKVPNFIKGPFKKALGIGSPSKVFAGYGQNITQGLVQGIQGSRSMLDGAMSGLTTDIAGPTLAPNVIGDTAGGLGGATEIENNIGTINIASEVDGQNWLQKLTRDQEIINRGLTPGATS